MRLGRRHSDRSGRDALLPVVVIAILALTSGCGSQDEKIPEATSSTTTTTTGPTGTTASSPKETLTTSDDDLTGQITAAYAAFWDARFKANEDPVNPDDPGLRDVATGTQLENVVTETAKRKSEGLAFRRPAQSSAKSDVKVVAIDGGEATVQECSVNDGVVYKVGTGEVVDESVVTHSVEGTLRRVDGRWKVSSTRLIQKWEGIGGCALSD